jgi:hypothetical protein
MCADLIDGGMVHRAAPVAAQPRALASDDPHSRMKVKSGCWGGSCRGRVGWGAGDDESKRRLGPWGLPRDLLLRGATRCAARCRTRALLWLAVFDGAFVGALGLEGEFAFGVAHRVVGRPDAAAALVARGAGPAARGGASSWWSARAARRRSPLRGSAGTRTDTRACALRRRSRSSARAARERADRSPRSGRAGGPSTSTPRPARGARCWSPAWRCGHGLPGPAPDCLTRGSRPR